MDADVTDHGGRMTEDRLVRWHESCAAARRRWAATPVVYGFSDCAPAILDIVRDATGIDAFAAFRGSYHDAPGARACVRANGRNLVGAIARLGKRYHWQRHQAANLPLDRLCLIGVSRTADGLTLLARMTQDFWLMRRPFGYCLLREPKLLALWSVC